MYPPPFQDICASSANDFGTLINTLSAYDAVASVTEENRILKEVLSDILSTIKNDRPEVVLKYIKYIDEKD